jgi:glycosyltransferase involved in cell wall biosynthesis
VGTIARLFKNKGYEDLCEAMVPAVANVRRLFFVWVGDGAYRDRFVKRVKDIGLADRLHLTGLVPPTDIPSIVGGFDIVAHASRWEGLPRALVQGQLLEVPGVSYDVDGAGEVIVDGETGYLAPFGDVGGFAAGIVKLARNRTLRKTMGRLGRERCLKAFDADVMVDGLDELYRRVGRRVSSATTTTRAGSQSK